MNRIPSLLPNKEQIDDIYNRILDITGLEKPKKSKTPLVREGSVLPEIKPGQIDPYFDALGAWDSKNIISIDIKRCEWAAEWWKLSVNSIIDAVTVHFCAEAVVQLGVHPDDPRDDKQYDGWNDPAKRFVCEGYPLKPTGPFLNEIIREQKQFAQFFSNLYYLSYPTEPEVLKAFKLLSKGHCNLYDIPKWDEAEARFEFWHKTRLVPVDKSEILEVDVDN
jgi:hypothetical protein